MHAIAAQLEGGHDALDAARQRYTATVDVFRRATAALASGKEQQATAETNLARFNDLDERIAIAGAEMVKQGLTADLPSALAAETEQRNAARQQAGLCAGALRVIQAEYDTAEKVLRAATAALSEQALKVMLGEAEQLADQLRAAHRQIWDLADSLMGLQGIAEAAAFNLTPDAVLRLRADLQPLRTVLRTERPLVPAVIAQCRREAAVHWRARFAELVGKDFAVRGPVTGLAVGNSVVPRKA
jgi:hypothetical protein